MIKLKIDKVVEQHEIEISTPYYAADEGDDWKTYYMFEDSNKVISISVHTSREHNGTSYSFHTEYNSFLEGYEDYITKVKYKISEDEWYKMYEEAIDFIEKNFEPELV